MSRGPNALKKPGNIVPTARAMHHRGRPDIGWWVYNGTDQVRLMQGFAPGLTKPSEQRISAAGTDVSYQYFQAPANEDWDRRNFQMAQQIDRLDMYAGFDEFYVHQNIAIKGHFAFHIPGAMSGGTVPADIIGYPTTFAPLVSANTPSSVSYFLLGGANYIDRKSVV